ncbi:MAG: sugar phosphate isomerase/epimerase [Chloroflexi bacterium]|nr:sugar phosphate isomerase/epimerase [Chloroflexota bacterium]
MTELALSTFWFSGRDWHLRNIFAAGAELGFDCFELSGIHFDTFYDEVRPGDFRIASLHDPAPPARGQTRIGSKELRRADIVYTSLDDERRRRAVAITKRSLDVAAEYGARAIVLHPGQTGARPQIEVRLKELFAQGKIHNSKANTLREQLAMERAHQRRERMDTLHRSLDELVMYASARNVKLGLENRPTHEITNFVEMGEILSWYPDDAVGYWHDTGHAQVQANLGFTPHAEWLRSYGNRIIGVHLHDAIGTTNHHAPGSGDVHWDALARHVPANALRVLEVDRTVDPDAARAGIAHLRATGWLTESEQ